MGLCMLFIVACYHHLSLPACCTLFMHFGTSISKSAKWFWHPISLDMCRVQVIIIELVRICRDGTDMPINLNICKGLELLNSSVFTETTCSASASIHYKSKSKMLKGCEDGSA